MRVRMKAGMKIRVGMQRFNRDVFTLKRASANVMVTSRRLDTKVQASLCFDNQTFWRSYVLTLERFIEETL